jgi:hypothetical protein
LTVGPPAANGVFEKPPSPVASDAATGAGHTEQEEIMTELFYWKEIERRARAAQALAMLHNRMDTDGIRQANAILDELCLDRKGAERLTKSRMPLRPSAPHKSENLANSLPVEPSAAGARGQK